MTKLMMLADAFYVPKDIAAKPDGEDAHFICEVAQVFGVADGVGGWKSKGIDAGIYARELMTKAESAVQNRRTADVNPKRVLLEAFLKTKAAGSSTACIISLSGDTLRAANMGDSGFVVIRGEKVIFRSPVQQSRFNCPYQLMKPIASSQEKLKMVVREVAKKVAGLAVKVKSGDVIIAGTDGLFDNLYPEAIERIVNDPSSNRGFLPVKLAAAALQISRDATAVTPFYEVARKAGKKHLGGKRDDITVVAAHIVRVPKIKSRCLGCFI